jgi:hypothetical protein
VITKTLWKAARTKALFEAIAVEKPAQPESQTMPIEQNRRSFIAALFGLPALAATGLSLAATPAPAQWRRGDDDDDDHDRGHRRRRRRSYDDDDDDYERWRRWRRRQRRWRDDDDDD